jgi:hypothetical protein
MRYQITGQGWPLQGGAFLVPAGNRRHGAAGLEHGAGLDATNQLPSPRQRSASGTVERLSTIFVFARPLAAAELKPVNESGGLTKETKQWQ